MGADFNSGMVKGMKKTQFSIPFFIPLFHTPFSYPPKSVFLPYLFPHLFSYLLLYDFVGAMMWSMLQQWPSSLLPHPSLLPPPSSLPHSSPGGEILLPLRPLSGLVKIRPYCSNLYATHQVEEPPPSSLLAPHSSLHPPPSAILHHPSSRCRPERPDSRNWLMFFTIPFFIPGHTFFHTSGSILGPSDVFGPKLDISQGFRLVSGGGPAGNKSCHKDLREGPDIW